MILHPIQQSDYNLRAMLPDLPIQPDFSLRRLNSFGLDAVASAYLHVTDSAMLDQVRLDPVLASLPRLVLGGGSNLLLTRDPQGLVLHMGNRGIAIVGGDDCRTLVRAAAGESWHGLVQWTLAQRLGGLENLSLIPGSVGAAPIQNIGAYGVEVGTLIDSLRYFDFETGATVTLDRTGCEFGYRDSVFKHRLAGRAVIVDVTFALPLPWQPNLQYAELQQALAEYASTSCTAPVSPDAAAISAAVVAIRTRKLPDPARIGNAGSFFKNPVIPSSLHAQLALHHPGLVAFAQSDGNFKLAAGWLIDQCGWKGRSLGQAGVYEKQALVLVNHGGATGAEILHLARTIEAEVWSRFGVALEAEPLII